MKDRFKFRIFDKDDKKIHDVIFINYENNGIEWLNEQDKKRAAFIGEVPTMQCTGLKDKNGKLIYEGDILYTPSWWWGNCFVYLFKGECGPCKSDNVMQYTLAKNIKNPLEGLCWNLWDGKDVEVIGNIYETPELLEE